jgi:hypothetical protein
VKVSIVVDLIHVLEYLWKGARCFYAEEDPNAEAWVLDRALEILAGEAVGSPKPSVVEPSASAWMRPGARPSKPPPTT